MSLSFSLSLLLPSSFFFFFKILFIYLFIRREGEREEEKHQCVVALHVSPAGDLACNSGMCPDWESNWRPLVHRPVLNPLGDTRQGSLPLSL